MEISFRVQIWKFYPLVVQYIILFTFIHRFSWKWRSYCVNVRVVIFINQFSQSMCSSFIQHVAFLNQNSIKKFITSFLCPSRLTSSSNDYSSFMSLNRHKISRDFISNSCWLESSISNVVHVKIMSVVDKEMQSIFSIFWRLNTWNLDGFVHSLLKCLHRFIKFSNQIDMSMLFILSFKSFNLISLVLHCLYLLLNVSVMLQDLHIWFTLVFLA